MLILKNSTGCVYYKTVELSHSPDQFHFNLIWNMTWWEYCLLKPLCRAVQLTQVASRFLTFQPFSLICVTLHSVFLLLLIIITILQWAVLSLKADHAGTGSCFCLCHSGSFTVFHSSPHGAALLCQTPVLFTHHADGNKYWQKFHNKVALPTWSQHLF